MKIETLVFGELEVKEDKLLTFANGIPGLEDLTQYVIIELEEGTPFSYLQSIENSHISFVVTSPFDFFKDYNFEIPKPIIEELEISEEKDVTVLSIVSVNQQNSEVTLNLLAPLIINNHTRHAKQIILHDSEYKIKQKIVLIEPDVPNESEGEVSC